MIVFSGDTHNKITVYKVRPGGRAFFVRCIALYVLIIVVKRRVFYY